MYDYHSDPVAYRGNRNNKEDNDSDGKYFGADRFIIFPDAAHQSVHHHRSQQGPDKEGDDHDDEEKFACQYYHVGQGSAHDLWKDSLEDVT